MGVHPDLITCDFSPNLISAITQIYGAEVIQIDLFHVMQELNRGIKADLLAYRERQFNTKRRELRNLRNWVLSIQRIVKKSHEFPTIQQFTGTLPEVDPSHEGSHQCLMFTLRIAEILDLTLPEEFFRELNAFLEELKSSDEFMWYFFEGVAKKMPKKRFTEKGLFRIKNEVLMKLKACYLWFRKPLDEKSLQFYRDLHVIFFQPENLTPLRKELLESFLTTHPQLGGYRTMTLLLGELSRLAPKEIDGHQINDLHENPSFSKPLNTAIKTIRKYRNHILRFVELSKKGSPLSRACHSNMEYYNKKFKEPFNSGNNLLKKERLLGRLNTQFSGKIEWFLEEKNII